MLWRLQYRRKGETMERDWKNSPGPEGIPLKKFASFSEAFEYFFGQQASRRQPDIFRYRLTPEFTTQPVEITFTPESPARQPGLWRTSGKRQMKRRVV